MAILITSMGGFQQASALMGTTQIVPGGMLDFYELLDGSGSIGSVNFAIETGATAAAFQAALTPTQFGIVRVTVIQFSVGSVVECQLIINNQNDLNNLIACVNNIVYQNGGSTCIACAYDTVTTELGLSPIDGVNDRSIVDLVTDGIGNSGNLASSFAAALAAGLDSSVVLGIGAVSISQLQTLVHPNPPGPLFNPLMAGDVLPDPLQQGFVIIVSGFQDFADAMLSKFIEIIIDDECDIFPDLPECVVGGELIPIDSTALLLAGAQTNAVWLMSALAAIGSVAFGALYIKSRKH